MSNHNSYDSLNRIPAEATKVFFRNFQWASAYKSQPARRTGDLAPSGANFPPGCLACAGFPNELAHDSKCMVSELDKRLLNNIAAEVAKSQHVDSLEGRVDELQKGRGSLTKDVEELQKIKSALQAERSTLQAGKDALQKELEQLHVDEDWARFDNTKLEEERDALKKELEASKKTKEVLNGKMQEYEQQLQEDQKDEGVVKALQGELDTLKSKLDEAEGDKTILRATSIGLWQANDALREKQEAANASITRYIQALGQRDDLLGQHEEQLRQYQHKDQVMTAVQTEVDALRQKLDGAEEVNKTLERTNLTANQAAVALQNANDALRTKLDTAEAAHNDFTRQLQQLEQQLQQHQQETPEEREARLIRFESEQIDELKKDVERGRTEKDRKKDYLAKQQARLRRLDAEHSRMQPQLEFVIKERRQKGRGKGKKQVSDE